MGIPLLLEYLQIAKRGAMQYKLNAWRFFCVKNIYLLYFFYIFFFTMLSKLPNAITTIIKAGRIIPFDEFADVLADECDKLSQTYLDTTNFFANKKEEEIISAAADYYTTHNISRLRHAHISEEQAQALIDSNQKVKIYANNRQWIERIRTARTYTNMGSCLAQYLSFFSEAFHRTDTEALFALHHAVRDYAESVSSEGYDEITDSLDMTPDEQAFLDAFEHNQRESGKKHEPQFDTDKEKRGMIIDFPRRPNK